VAEKWLLQGSIILICFRILMLPFYWIL